MERTNILIVEDDPIIAADLQDRLEDLGYVVLGPVAAGEAALELVKAHHRLDLVLMDIQLEGVWDGIETARHIRQQRELPLIFLTSNSDEGTFSRAKAINPQAFLSKPFRSRDLAHAIELALQRSAKVEKTAEPPTQQDSFLLADRLFIKVKDRMVRLFFKEILWVEADDYYCKVVTREKNFLVTQTLGKFSEAFEKMPAFMRVHRSFLVNLEQVEEIGELYLHIGSKQVPFSKNLREEIMVRLRSA